MEMILLSVLILWSQSVPLVKYGERALLCSIEGPISFWQYLKVESQLCLYPARYQLTLYVQKYGKTNQRI